MTAKQLIRFAREKGIRLIGLHIVTERTGSWPGGNAEIIELAPDSSAPEILFRVRHLSENDPEAPGNEIRRWEIGVFEWEEVQL